MDFITDMGERVANKKDKEEVGKDMRSSYCRWSQIKGAIAKVIGSCQELGSLTAVDW